MSLIGGVGHRATVRGHGVSYALFHTYSCYSRGVDMLNCAYHYLDLSPKGRDEVDQGPNPRARVRRHDEYED